MTPLVKAKIDKKPVKDRINSIIAMCEHAGMTITRAKAKEILHDEMKSEMWHNDVYTVLLREGANCDNFVMLDEWKGKCAYISIRRNDREPVDSWRDFQEIKNQLCGNDREAVQIYPNEARLTDCANQYHLWVLPDGVMFPMGFFDGRVVTSGDTEHHGIITKQSNR